MVVFRQLRSCKPQKKALLLFGAGASIDYGMPSTTRLTDEIEAFIKHDSWLSEYGSSELYFFIKDCLTRYLTSPGDVNFEQIYHCAHELIYAQDPISGAVDSHRPILAPFLNIPSTLDSSKLIVLCDGIVHAIHHISNHTSRSLKAPISLMKGFLSYMLERYISRIYTTNYDDFVFQALPNLHTGYGQEFNGKRTFCTESFWSNLNTDCLYHIHGSIHMGYDHPTSPDGDFGEIYWFDDYDSALKKSTFSGSDMPRMDGGGLQRASIITGLEKTSRLQQKPFSYYYASLARDAIDADMIIISGSGLSDFHLNSWLKEARLKKPKTPLVLIDYWKGDFLEHAFDLSNKQLQMIHTLRIPIAEPYAGIHHDDGWITDQEKTVAIWDGGFSSFLSNRENLVNAEAHLGLQ